jgi:three-Cys-motif partner protein
VEDHYTGGGDKTVAKLVTLEKYVNSYINIMLDNWPYGDLWYIDTHAGTGFVEMDRYGSRIPGSAVRIIQNHSNDFDRFYLYEADADRFDLLQDTLADEFRLGFDRWETDAGFLVAKSENPRIMLFRTNSNEGIQWLSEKAYPSHHWFVFMDPEGVVDLEANAFKAVINRGNADLLINFQTTGALRAAGWDPSRGSVQRLGGNTPLQGGDLDDQVEWFKHTIEKSSEYETTSRKTESETEQGHRFDLVFTSSNDTAIHIMSEIMDKSLKKDIAGEIQNCRIEGGQQGLENWRNIQFIQHGDEGESESHRDDGQSGLADFD